MPPALFLLGERVLLEGRRRAQAARRRRVRWQDERAVYGYGRGKSPGPIYVSRPNLPNEWPG